MGLIIDQPDEITGKLYPKDIINHVLLVWATDYIEHSPTQYNDGSDPKKPCDVVVVDVIDLDQLDENQQLGLVSRGSWWRQGRLIQRFKPRVGRPNPLVGRISKGLGPNGAFEFIDLSSDERTVARANAWWAANPGFEPSPPLSQRGAAPAPRIELTPPAPVPQPSPLENAANASLGGQETPAQRLQRLSREMHQGMADAAANRVDYGDTPPF